MDESLRKLCLFGDDRSDLANYEYCRVPSVKLASKSTLLFINSERAVPFFGHGISKTSFTHSFVSGTLKQLLTP